MNAIFSHRYNRLLMIIISLLFIYLQPYAQQLPNSHFKKIDSINKLIKENREKYTIPYYFQLSQELRKSSLDSSYFYIDKTIDLSVKHNNSLYECEGYRAIGELYFFESKYNNALYSFEKALKTIEKTKDSSLYPYITASIGGVHRKQGNFDKALKKLKAAQEYSLYRNDTYIITNIYLELTGLFLDINLLTEADFYLKKGLELAEKTNNTSFQAWFHYNEAKILKNKGKLDEAIHLLNEKLNTSKFVGDDFTDFRISCFKTISDSYYLKNDFKKSLKYAFKAEDLFTSENAIFNRKRSDIFHSIGRIYIKLEDFNKAEKYLTTSLNLAKKNKKNRLALECYNDLYLLFKTKNNTKKALYYLEQNLFLKQSEEDSDLSNMIVSIKTSEKLKKQFVNLNNQKLHFEKQEVELKKQIELSRFERCLLIIIFLFCSILMLLLYRHNLAKNEKRVFSFKLRSLRAQMNPHFIFNTLNAIQNYVLNEDRITAYKQLTRFSKSIRFILNETEQDFVPIKKEVDFIKDYVALEKLRFGSRLNFFLFIDTDKDINTFLIPTLILQPIIENAIIHGISNKEEGGYVKLKISFEKNKLVLRIEDNGIGRIKAKKIKEQFLSNKRSISSINITKRLGLLKSINIGDTDIQIIDLNVDEGTIVIVKLPILKIEEFNYEKTLFF